MTDVVEPKVVEPPKPPRQNPLLSQRMVNAYARTLGCTEPEPTELCDHRTLAKRALIQLIAFYGVEKE